MLPAPYELPIAVALVLGGTIACFAGYRLFRMVLAIYGFIAGAMLASSMMASSNALGMVVAGLVGGVIGSLVLFFAYFIGIALIGAGLGALATHAVWAQISAMDPPVLMVVVFFAAGCLEVISILFRPVSLSFRLYGNIFAGETMLETMAAMPRIGWLVQIPFYFLELLVGFVQAMVFMLLTAVFTLLICQHHEEASSVAPV